MKITISGTIISQDDKLLYDWYQRDSTAPNDVELPEDPTEDMTVDINSMGGDIYAGAEIYTKLKSYPGEVTVNIVGLAASAATFIAMAADHIKISPMGQMMIHEPSVIADGDSEEHAKMAKVLKGVEQQIAESYAKRSGRSVEDFVKLMKEETWFTAKEAVENGLADEVMFDNEKVPAMANGFGMLSVEEKEKARNAIVNKQVKQDKVAVSKEELQDAVRILESKIESVGTDKSLQDKQSQGRFIF